MRIRVVGVVAASVLMAMTVTPVASADAVHNVNLGDSFSAGSGVLPLAPGSPLSCYRSSENFASVIAREQGYQFTDVSCGGAATEDFYGRQMADTPPQLDALSASTDVVTLMIGGNDGDVFGKSIAQCIDATARNFGAVNPCEQRFGNTFADTVETNTFPAVKKALQDVHAKAPNAKVVIAGYPWLVPAAGGCFPTMPIVPGDLPFLRNLQATLNSVIERAANETDTAFADMSKVSEGRDACAPLGTRWIEPLLFPAQFVPVHPNALGERAIAAEVTKALAGA